MPSVRCCILPGGEETEGARIERQVIGVGTENIVDAGIVVRRRKILRTALSAVDVQRAGVRVGDLSGKQTHLELHNVVLLLVGWRDGGLRVPQRGIDRLLLQVVDEIGWHGGSVVQGLCDGLAAVPHHRAQEFQVRRRQWTAVNRNRLQSSRRVGCDGASVGIDDGANRELSGSGQREGNADQPVATTKRCAPAARVTWNSGSWRRRTQRRADRGRRSKSSAPEYFAGPTPSRCWPGGTWRKCVRLCPSSERTRRSP